MNALEKIKARKKQVTFPSEGFCRVENCGAYYSRQTSGRKGMCKTHYYYTDQLVKSGEITWEEVDAQWPVAREWLGMAAPKIAEIRLLETEFQNLMMSYLLRNGHGVWMLDPSRRRGIPDLLVVTKTGKVLFRELKASGQPLSQAQEKMMEKMAKQGADVGVWEPDDYDSGLITKEVEG